MLYKANNSLSTIELFQERKKYKENVSLVGSYDFWYDTPSYGKVDRQGQAASLSETNLKQLQTSKTLFAVDFVADAYLDLLNHLAKRTAQRRIVLTSPFHNLELETAWISVNSLYHSFMELLYGKFFAAHVPGFKRDSEIKDFDSFIHEFLTFARLNGDSMIICKSSFIKHNSCPNAISGLILEIKQEKNEDDSQKQLLMENSSFLAFQRAARLFGFWIDKNNPYRLVFNIGSKQAQKYIKKYGISTSVSSMSDLFDIYYYQVNIQQDIGLLKSYLSRFWESYIQARPWVRKGCKTIQRQPCPESLINNENYWFKVYVIVRLFGGGLDANSKEGFAIVEKAVALRKYVDERVAIGYIETVLRNR